MDRSDHALVNGVLFVMLCGRNDVHEVSIIAYESLCCYLLYDGRIGFVFCFGSDQFSDMQSPVWNVVILCDDGGWRKTAGKQIAL